MKYKCKRSNDEICYVTINATYIVGNTIEIKLDTDIVETVSILEIVK